MRSKILLLLLMCVGLLNMAWAQGKTVSGRVADAKGSPLANASVTVKNTRVGTTTKDDGTFFLDVPANTRTLVISAVGFGNP